MATTGYIYNSFDNQIDLLFKDDGVVVDLSAATKFEVVINGTTIDSVITPSAFDLTDVATGQVKLDFGGQSIVAGIYAIRVVVYDAINVEGIVWVHENGPNLLYAEVI